MPHNLYIGADGQARMFSAREVPWHGLGTVLDGPATSAEAIAAAKLDWRVRKVPLWACEGPIVSQVPDRFAIVPEDRWGKDDAPVFGVVGRGYTPLQNSEAFQFFDEIVGKRAAIYHTAGALDDGRRVWILAKLPQTMRIIRDDISEKYLLLVNGHDGNTSVQIKFTPVRVVCQNTLNMALREGRSTCVHHGAGFWRRMNDAAGAIGFINYTFSQIELKLRQMTLIDMCGTRLRRYMDAVFPIPTNANDRLRTFVEGQRSRCAMLFEEGAGNDGPGVRGTLYAAFNGVTEYVDHYRSPGEAADRMESIWFGQGNQIKSRAYRLAADPSWLTAGS